MNLTLPAPPSVQTPAEAAFLLKCPLGKDTNNTQKGEWMRRESKENH